MMYKEDQFYLWKKLSEVQQNKITKLIEKYLWKFGTENPIEHCGGGTIVDYYEPKLNIVIEYDEPHHFDINGNLKNDDIFRMNYIKQTLQCDFYRIKSTTNEIKKF
jgi:hypothetical protein